MKRKLMLVWLFLQSILLSPRVKSLAWHCAGMLAAEGIQIGVENLSSLHLSTPWTVFIGLVLGQVTKALNNSLQGKEPGFIG